MWWLAPTTMYIFKEFTSHCFGVLLRVNMHLVVLSIQHSEGCPVVTPQHTIWKQVGPQVETQNICWDVVPMELMMVAVVPVYNDCMNLLFNYLR